MKKLLLAAVLIAMAAVAQAGMGTVNVTTSETVVLPYTQGRKWLILQNLSDTDIYLKMDSSSTALTSSNGIKLTANGGMLTIMAGPGQGNPAMNKITALHAGSGSKVLRWQGGNEN